ncbi:MAG: hypothetical protein QOJ30_3307 [Pseudonocardiales bacterium]|nr:hypothetical protein [Pseudonocardiales bacterium]
MSPLVRNAATTSSMIGALTLDEDDRRVLAVWAADCAEQEPSLFQHRKSHRGQ